MVEAEEHDAKPSRGLVHNPVPGDRGDNPQAQQAQQADETTSASAHQSTRTAAHRDRRER